MALTLGIDVAVRAAHQGTLARDGITVWRGRKFSTRPAELERLWDDLNLADPGDLTVVVEPTRNAWIVVAEWSSWPVTPIRMRCSGWVADV